MSKPQLDSPPLLGSQIPPRLSSPRSPIGRQLPLNPHSPPPAARSSSGREYKVKNMSLADFGRLEIELAEVEMPGLMACRTKDRVQVLGHANFSALQKEVASLGQRYAFGANLDLELLGLEVDDKTLVPGLAVASSRGKPLAAWINGLEVCSVEVDVPRACLILSVGISTRYIYAMYKKTVAATTEAEAWEAAKKACGGLHFLAIQENLDSDDCVGFWLLLDLPPPPVLGWKQVGLEQELCIRFGVEARALMLKGVEDIADAVKVTMGPKLLKMDVLDHHKERETIAMWDGIITRTLQLKVI